MLDALRDRSGMTSAEAAASAALLAITLVAVAGVGATTRAACVEGQAAARLAQKAQRAVTQIAHEIERCGPAELADWKGPSSAVRFVRSADGKGWSRAILFEGSPSELDNNVDDDGNGLVDEGRVVLVTRVEGQARVRTTLARGVCEHDPHRAGGEPGLCFTRVGDTVSVRLILEAIGPEGAHLVASAERSVVAGSNQRPGSPGEARTRPAR